VRNIGLFTQNRVDSHDLAKLVRSLAEQGSWPLEDRREEFVIGALPNLVFIAKDTSLSNGCFDDGERAELQAQLGFDPQSYIDLHFSYTDDAYKLARSIGQAMQSEWRAMLDYSGTGGQLGTPPPVQPGPNPSS
jgi:hypothetical protein